GDRRHGRRRERSRRQQLARPGGVAEWSIAAVLKTAGPRGLVGSNPTPSATIACRGGLIARRGERAIHAPGAREAARAPPSADRGARHGAGRRRTALPATIVVR